MLQVQLNAVLQGTIAVLTLELRQLYSISVRNDELSKDNQKQEKNKQRNDCDFVEVFVLFVGINEVLILRALKIHYINYNFIMSSTKEHKGLMPGYIRQGVPPHL